MNRVKCSHCDLVNLASDPTCRRCGQGLGPVKTGGQAARSPREAARRSSPLYTLLAVALIGGVVAYFYLGVEKSFNDVKANDANRIASQPKRQTDGLSRSELDQKRTGQYGNAIQNSPGLAASQKRLEETQKLMQPPHGNTQK